MRVVGFVRPGPAAAEERKAEESAIRAWAQQHGHEVLAIYGLPPADEAHWVWQQVSKSLLEGRIGGLVLPDFNFFLFPPRVHRSLVYALGRSAGEIWHADSSRSLDRRLGPWGFIDSLAAIEDYRQEMNDLHTEFRLALAANDRAMAESYKEYRAKSGRLFKHMRGGYAYGAPPFGWQAVEGDLIEHPEEQATLNRARALQEDGLSLRAICRVLDAEGRRPRRGGHWNSGTLSRSLRHSR